MGYSCNSVFQLYRPCISNGLSFLPRIVFGYRQQQQHQQGEDEEEDEDGDEDEQHQEQEQQQNSSRSSSTAKGKTIVRKSSKTGGRSGNGLYKLLLINFCV